MKKTFRTMFAGRELIVETGQMAQLAAGAVFLRYGDTNVLATATMSKAPREGLDFFPLSVDYEEKLYSVGKIPGGFIKREGRPSEKAILSSRLIDRPIRPLFPEGMRNDVQVVATVLSVEQDNLPEIVAMVGSSIALSISEIPFDGPIGAVAVGYIDGEYVMNPTVAQREDSALDLVVSGTKEAIMMVEAGADEVSEELMIGAILAGHEEIKKMVAFQEEIIAEIGKEKCEVVYHVPQQDIVDRVMATGYEKMNAALRNSDKSEREIQTEAVAEEIRESLLEEYEEREEEVNQAIDTLKKSIVRNMIAKEKIRPDGRALDEIRPIACEVGLLARVHGSGLFTRGQTQALSVVTLGAFSDVQIIDGITDEEYKRYMHHYNFPSFSVGETRPSRGPGRREIGHGALAGKAILPVLPSQDDFPYTIRVVSEVLMSNGSSSQASVCGSTLSLMDAGVPIKAPVAGIAMGLIKEEDDISILSDIQGVEDHNGDMDFKVAGTRDGITAIQMDIKIHGIDEAVLREALEQARKGRIFILEKMAEVISEPREEMSPYAPRMLSMEIPSDKIGEVIGPGGKMINKIIEATGVKIDIMDDGKAYIASPDLENAEKAKSMIEAIIKEVEVGEIYNGKVVRIIDIGAFVELLPGKEGMVHISKLAHEHVKNVTDVVQVGDSIQVKVTEIDSRGRINLSRKDLLPKPEGYVERPERPRNNYGGGRSGERGRGGYNKR
ncbi:MAG: polyribonucleotide nucleotidyltransferase [Eubacteriaceae bacterium]|jgi:polyribonucleotide nucleotidyltransferase|nr:polyribonucleotide nucleotidyltransferase [Eubacteriaceae bacterium]